MYEQSIQVSQVHVNTHVNLVPHSNLFGACEYSHCKTAALVSGALEQDLRIHPEKQATS